MKAVLLFTAVMVFITGCAYMRSDKTADLIHAEQSGNFSNTGAIALHDEGYRFIVILVKDLAWALESTKIADYGLPHISQFKRGEKVSPFLTFVAFNKGNANLTHSVKLKKPDGKFDPKEYNNLLLARSAVNDGMVYHAQEFATINLDTTYDLGTYQLYIVIKDGKSIRNACIIQFILTE